MTLSDLYTALTAEILKGNGGLELRSIDQFSTPEEFGRVYSITFSNRPPHRAIRSISVPPKVHIYIDDEGAKTS